MKTYTHSQIYSLVKKQYKKNVTLRTIRNWFQQLTPINYPAKRNEQYSVEDVATVLANHGIPQLKISLVQSQTNNDINKKKNTKIATNKNNNTHQKSENSDLGLINEENSLKIKLLEEFIIKNTSYRFCDDKFKHDLHNKRIYDESFSNLLFSINESKLQEAKKAAQRIESLDLEYYFQKRKRD